MNRIATGIIFGITAGIIDVIPMVLQKLAWDANLSAFSMWVIAGFLISTNGLRIHSMVKGILISFSMLIPCAFLIGWHQPISLVPISIMTLILGSLLGFAIQKFSKNK